jgi:putative ABC transport system substrate-binding protein
MQRRDFITLLSGAAVAWPLGAHAQASSGRPLVVILSPQPSTTAAPNLDALRRGLSELGYVEGRNIWLEIRYADGAPARLPALAKELVARKPDVIVAGSAAGVLAAQGATKAIPIVMFSILDPVELGVAKSIVRPGGNATGLWMFGGGDDSLVSKRIELLKEIVPALTRMAVIAAARDPSDQISLQLLPAATRALNVAYDVFEVQTTADLEAAFARAAREGIQAIFVNQNPFLFSRRAELAMLAARAHLPAIYGFREHVEAGGLISYGSSLPGAYFQAARLVDKILKGTNPADLPIEQPTTFELVVNLKTAKALGLTIPPRLLARADGVIE